VGVCVGLIVGEGVGVGVCAGGCVIVAVVRGCTEASPDTVVDPARYVTVAVKVPCGIMGKFSVPSAPVAP
jgi:hypothetical protein